MAINHPFYDGPKNWETSVHWLETDDPVFQHMCIDHEYYMLADSINVLELMVMLFDPEISQTSRPPYSDKEVEEIFDRKYEDILRLITDGLISGQIEAVNFSPTNTYEESLNIWDINLIKQGAFLWIKEKDIINLIESASIDIPEKFKNIISNLPENPPSLTRPPKRRGRPTSHLKIHVQEAAIQLRKEQPTIPKKDLPYRRAITNVLAPQKANIGTCSNEEYFKEYGMAYRTVYNWISECI